MCSYIATGFKPDAGFTTQGGDNIFQIVFTCAEQDLYFNYTPPQSGATDGIDILFPVGAGPEDLTTAELCNNIIASIHSPDGWQISYDKDKQYWRITTSERVLGRNEKLIACFANVQGAKKGQTICSCTLNAKVKTLQNSYRTVSETTETPLTKRDKPRIVAFSGQVVRQVQNLTADGFVDVDALAKMTTVAVNIRPYVCPPDPPTPPPTPPTPPTPPKLKDVEIKWTTTDADSITIYVDNTYHCKLDRDSGSQKISIEQGAVSLRLEVASSCLSGLIVSDTKTITL